MLPNASTLERKLPDRNSRRLFYKLSGKEEFSAVIKKRTADEALAIKRSVIYGRYFVLYKIANSQGVNRLGVVVEKRRAHTAVARNTIKRIVVHMLRNSICRLSGNDLVIRYTGAFDKITPQHRVLLRLDLSDLCAKIAA